MPRCCISGSHAAFLGRPFTSRFSLLLWSTTMISRYPWKSCNHGSDIMVVTGFLMQIMQWNQISVMVPTSKYHNHKCAKQHATFCYQLCVLPDDSIVPISDLEHQYVRAMTDLVRYSYMIIDERMRCYVVASNPSGYASYLTLWSRRHSMLTDECLMGLMNLCMKRVYETLCSYNHYIVSLGIL